MSAAYSRRAASSPPARLPLIIVLAVLPRIVERAAAPARIAIGGVPVAPAIEADEVVVPGVAARNGAAHREAALRLVVQRHDELRTIVGLAVQRLIRDGDHGSRQCGRRDALEHVLGDG